MEKNCSFEESITRLEALVNRMEQGNLPIEKMVEAFEQGAKLAASCRKQLESLEKKIELLSHDDGKDGAWSDFEPDEPARPAVEPQDAPQDELFSR